VEENAGCVQDGSRSGGRALLERRRHGLEKRTGDILRRSERASSEPGRSLAQGLPSPQAAVPRGELPSPVARKERLDRRRDAKWRSQAPTIYSTKMGVSIERELNDLERGITALRIEYERFFGGELKRPPLVPRRAIEENLRRLGNAEIDKAAERYRLQTVQSRYNAYAELWEKRMRAREEGQRGSLRRPPAVVGTLATGTAAAATASGAGAPAPQSGKKSAEGPDVLALLAAAEAAVARKAPAPTPVPQPDAAAPPSVQPRSRVDFTPLFRRYVDARQALGEDVSKLKYEKFEEAVRRQAEEIRRKTGSSRLVFEVQTADGRVRLVGRPASPGSKG